MKEKLQLGKLYVGHEMVKSQPASKMVPFDKRICSRNTLEKGSKVRYPLFQLAHWWGEWNQHV